MADCLAQVIVMAIAGELSVGGAGPEVAGTGQRALTLREAGTQLIGQARYPSRPACGRAPTGDARPAQNVLAAHCAVEASAQT